MRYLLCAAVVLFAAATIVLPRAVRAVEGRLATGEGACNAECRALGLESVRLGELIDAAEREGDVEAATRLRRERARVIARWHQRLHQPGRPADPS